MHDSEDNFQYLEKKDFPDKGDERHGGESITKVSGMYKNWFLDYASYVILERAVPSIHDGLKPVQRRILHSLKELDDGRYNKVANIVGNTMKYHPHGDASIGDALVQIGQKKLMIDTQGNWGNTLTGDGAAAPRYIEARLSQFALEVGFNPKITQWQSSYDGRNKEPINLPIKFPLLLAQGVEGIAVGLSTKILPHNFNELIDASIKVLKGRKAIILPDFLTGGTADSTHYNDGKRGGKIRVRAKIKKIDNSTLSIGEIPFGNTTSSIIDSILKANEKGKIRIKKIDDNTAESADILIHLSNGVSPDKTIDALYAFTNCEVSISPHACVIEDEKPVFMGVSDILQYSTKHTKELFEQELTIKLGELQEQLHFASLERIFIENRIYRNIEQQNSWEGVLNAIDQGLKPFAENFIHTINQGDLIKLTEIKIKRISKFDLGKAKKNIENLEISIAEIQHHLEELTDYVIQYFKDLKKKYGKQYPRKTEIRVFEDIQKQKVAIANVKLYGNFKEGFIGSSLRREDYLLDCSDIDDLIIFRKNGTMMVTKTSPKSFVGKDIIYVSVFEKKDTRTVYNMIYKDGKSNHSFMKRFFVTSITRDKEYNLLNGNKESKVLYFTANPNGEAEVVTVYLRALRNIRKIKFDIDFSNLAIKGREVKGNLVTKNSVKRIELKKEGLSTLGAIKVWFDDIIMRLNTEGRGELLGEFHGEDKILCVYQSGIAELISVELNKHFDRNLILIEKWIAEKPLSCIYFEPNKKRFYVKRFLLENQNSPQLFIPNRQGIILEMVSTDYYPRIETVFKKNKILEKEVIELESFISLKGIKAQGNQLTPYEVQQINSLPPLHLKPENKEKEVQGLVEQLNLDFDDE